MKDKTDDFFSCPDCGYPQICPCPACKEVPPIKPWQWANEKRGDIACSGCGVIKHVDEWQDLAITYFNNKKRENHACK